MAEILIILVFLMYAAIGAEILRFAVDCREYLAHQEELRFQQLVEDKRGERPLAN